MLLIALIQCTNIASALNYSKEKEILNPKEDFQIKEEEIEKIIYESFLPIDSLLFLIEINNLNESETRYLIEHTVIAAKNYLLKNKEKIEEILKEFDMTNLDLKVKDKGLKIALEMRNRHFENDKSQISKKLFVLDKQRIKSTPIKIFSTKNLDIKYIKMIQSLKKVILDNGNLGSAIKRERKEFIKSFKKQPKLSKKNKKHLKMNFNLGGSIFKPSLLLQIINQTVIENKADFISKNVTKILKPLIELKLSIKHLSPITKKDQILKFLQACYVRDDWMYKDILDDAFGARSSFLEAFLNNNNEEDVIKKEKMLDKFQEEEILVLKNQIIELEENEFLNFLVLNEKVLEKYICVLSNGTKGNENELEKMFE